MKLLRKIGLIILIVAHFLGLDIKNLAYEMIPASLKSDIKEIIHQNIKRTHKSLNDTENDDIEIELDKKKFPHG